MPVPVAHVLAELDVRGIRDVRADCLCGLRLPHVRDAVAQAPSPISSRPCAIAARMSSWASCVLSAVTCTSTFSMPHHLGRMVAARSRGMKKAPAVVARA